MRLTDLRHAKVRTVDGDTVGRVFEVHCDGGRMTALMCGAGGFLERLTGKTEGRPIPWEEVVAIDRGGIVVGPETPSASRSRRGTRRATAPRSRR
jgi:sporulation protein YlmC with PRC-barrel domain